MVAAKMSEEGKPESEKKEEETRPKFDKKALLSDALYFGIKGIGGSILKALTDLKVDGQEYIPIRGKAILTTISKNVFQDMLVISQLTGRKVHFMLHPKIMKHQVAGPILKTIGMIRGTENKDDTEPVDKVFEILNEIGDLVALTPEARLDRETQVKSMAGIIKFACAGNAPIIPLIVYGAKTKLFNLIPAKGLRVKIGKPIEVDKKLNRDKFRDQRYQLAEEILKIIEGLRPVETNGEKEIKREESQNGENKGLY
jgi:1-acyl-sn-glycerol-3-phosphate acyltransferase